MRCPAGPKPLSLFIVFLILAPVIASAQTSQTFTITSGSTMTLNVRAGDQVTVDATLFSGDPNENGEGEPLVVMLPGGNFVVSSYFAPAQTTFLALQDNQTVSAFIRGFDGDESAQVTFTANAKKRYTQEEKDKFARYAAILGGVGGTLGTIGGICGLAPEPTATKVCAVVGALGAGASAILAARYGLMALDPCDPNFGTIFEPQLLTIPPITVQDGVTQAEADAANAWLLNDAQQVAYSNAITVSLNRANCASSSGDTAAEARQIQAAVQYATQLAGYVGAAAGARANLVSAIRGAGFRPVTASAYDVFNYEINIFFYGLPPLTREAAVDLGADPDTLRFITGLLLVQDINATAGTFPDILASSTITSAEQDVAAALNQFAADNGGVPLKAGQMVQAQGWVAGATGKTTFSVEAHVDQQGKLLGKLQLNDHGGLSIRQGAVAHAFLLGGNNTQFSVDGTYIASDGSTQKWNVRGDSQQQSVAISTSPGFSASGVVGGGNVTVKP